MRKTLIAAALALPLVAHAQDFIHLHAGIGVADSSDMGDGTWVQYGMKHSEKLITPAFELGITGDLLKVDSFGLSYHADYVNLGRVSASTLAVADDQYNPKTHQVIGGAASNPENVAAFSGAGSTQGIALTLEPTYTWRGIRFGIEGGAFFFKPTWTEQVTPYGAPMFSVSHNPKIQTSWIAGASVEYKNFGLSYRYYNDRSTWNPYPGLIEKTHVLMLTYKY